MNAQEPGHAPLSPARCIFVLFLGVLAPLAALLVELSSGVCAGELFDPLPTFVHVLLVAAVPVLCAAGLSGRFRSGCGRLAAFAWGVTLGVAAVYCVPFGLLAPASVIGILFAGLGFCSLAPLTALVSLVWTRPGAFRADDDGTGTKQRARIAAGAGVFAGVALLTLADLPTVLAARDLRVASIASESPDRTNAIRRLRSRLTRESIDRVATGGGATLSPVSLFAGMNPRPADAQFAAWMVTGSVPRERPRADSFGLRSFDDFEGGWTTTDADMGGRRVGAPVGGLSLAASSMDGVVRADAAVADVMWSLTFANDSAVPAEARLLLDMPVGAVISDATLLVAGKPRAAAFAPVAKARAAYEKVVRVERRDPLLVTSPADGSVLVQCFPVPPRGRQDIVLRVAVPLVPDGSHRLVLRFPQIAARNFGFDDSTTDCGSLRVLGRVMAVPAGLTGPAAEAVADGTVTWDTRGAGTIGPGGPITLHTALGSGSPAVAVADPFEPGRFVSQTWGPDTAPAPARILVVLDASGAMREAQSAVLACIAGLPEGIPLAVVAASDDVVRLTDGFEVCDGPRRTRLLAAIGALPWAGGVDSEPALHRATEIADTGPGALRLWLHGPQAMTRDESAAGSGSPYPFHPIRFAPGENVLLTLGRVAALRAALPEDPAAAFAQLTRRGRESSEAVIARRTRAAGPVPGSGRIADERIAHALAAVWAADAASGMETSEAAKFAPVRRIVTRQSAAVVLETDAEYAQSGITPPGVVPIVPEPGTWAILAIVALVIAWDVIRRRRRAAA